MHLYVFCITFWLFWGVFQTQTWVNKHFPKPTRCNPTTIDKIITHGFDELLPCAVLFDAETSVLADSVSTEGESSLTDVC